MHHLFDTSEIEKKNRLATEESVKYWENSWWACMYEQLTSSADKGEQLTASADGGMKPSPSNEEAGKSSFCVKSGQRKKNALERPRKPRG